MSNNKEKKGPIREIGFWIMILIIASGILIYTNSVKILIIIEDIKRYSANFTEQRQQQATIQQADDLYEAAKVHLSQQKFKLAIPILLKASELKPKDKTLSDDYVRALIQTSDFTTALENIYGCGYDECTDLMDMLYEKVQEYTIENGLEIKNLSLLIQSYSNITGRRSELCNTTKLLIELAMDEISLSSAEDKRDFKYWIDSLNPVDQKNIRRYKNEVPDDFESEFIPWLYWQYSDTKDSKKKIGKYSNSVNAYTVLMDTRKAGISRANNYMHNRSPEQFFGENSCTSLEVGVIDYTYFKTSASGELKGSNSRYLDFDTSDNSKIDKFSTHIENVYNFNLFNTLYQHCVKAGRC